MFFEHHGNGIFGAPSGVTYGAYESLGELTLTSGQNCGDVKLLQQMLKDLGFYAGSVDGAIGNQTLKALSGFASAHGVPYTPGSFPKGAICDAIQSTWTAAQAPAPSPGPTTSPAPAPAPAGGGVSPLVRQVTQQVTTRLPPQAAPIVANGGAGGALSSLSTWWNSQSTMVKAGLVGGALFAVGLAIYAAKRSYTPNRRHRRYRPNRSRRRGGSGGSKRSACAMKGVKTCRCKPPKGYPKRRSVYALPECWMYPLDNKKRVRTAAARFGKHKRRYPKSVQRRIAGKIQAAKRRFRIGEYK